MKKKLAIVILAITIAALWVTPAFAAQGVITEVNPSGVGTGVILQADEGEEIIPEQPGNDNRNDAAAGKGAAGWEGKGLSEETGAK